MTRRTQHGFTLVEVMVVVAILAILASLAVVAIKPRTSAVDTGHQFRALVDQASREAVRAGAVRPDVATALGLRARTQVVAQMNGDTLTFYAQRLVEDDAPATSATWQTLDTFTLPSWVRAAAYSSQVGGYSSITLATDWDSFTISCFPNGTCERKTVFFESSTGSSSSRQSRVAVLPVATAQVIGTWN
jgi:prepilin-type N-terminal cleavage/methylation domain-containing protein